MAKRKRRKASGFTDEERAEAVTLLHLRGWPDQKGALTAVANHLKIWPKTLSRWATGASNPPPDKIVQEKTFDLVGGIKAELTSILRDMPGVRPEADYKSLATGFGILTDKYQLLTGGPTETIHQKSVQFLWTDASSRD